MAITYDKTLNICFKHILGILSIVMAVRTRASASLFLSSSPSQERICADRKKRYVDEWEIPIENMTFGELIGKGAFGQVYSATLSNFSPACGQSSLKLKKLSDGFEQEGKIDEGIESTKTVAVKSIHRMLMLLPIRYC